MQTRSSEFFSEVQFLDFFCSQSVFGSDGSKYALTATLEGNVDAIIVYATKEAVQRRFRTLSRSTNIILGSGGYSGPPCGVPSPVGSVCPLTITPAFNPERIRWSIALAQSSFTKAARYIF